MSLAKEFREFISRGNVVDLAVGVIIGGAFGAIVKSLVDQIIMPPIGLLTGGVDFAALKLVLKPAAGAMTDVAPPPDDALMPPPLLVAPPRNGGPHALFARGSRVSVP